MRVWAALYAVVLTTLSVLVLGVMVGLGLLALALYAVDVIDRSW